MNTKNIFKTVALAMLMPAMLLTTACSNQDDVANTSNITSKGYALPVTVNVTRQDGATRATFDGSKLNFSAGDKLFVKGTDYDAGSFAGTLNYVSGGTFSGTIYTQNSFPSTADNLFKYADSKRAALLPAGYGSYGYLTIEEEGTYNADLDTHIGNAFALTKAAAVEQFSLESASSYSSGFALRPQNAIVSFTISGLTANKEVAVLFKETSDAGATPVDVTTDASGVATFAVGMNNYTNFNNYSLTVDGNAIALPADKYVEAGHIYKISRKPDLLSGVFSVSSTKKVKFSKGNLRYASSKWSFFDNQYDYYTSYSADAWDKFGWSTSATTYGMNTSTDNGTYSGAFVDWGATIGTGWFTLSSAEWTYLFNNRSASNGRYAKAKVNNVQGVILFPDTYTHPDGVTAPTGVNDEEDAGWNGNNYSSADWTKMESAGCVFLPAAGYRDGSSVKSPGSYGNYWSATLNGAGNAYNVDFASGYLDPALNGERYYGVSVRLVREVTE